MEKSKYIINETIIRGKVINICRTYILVAFDGNVGICHISNVSDYLVRNLRHFFNFDDYYDFLIIGNDQVGQFSLSYKAIHPKFLKNHKNVIPTPSGFKNLKADLDERLRKL